MHFIVKSLLILLSSFVAFSSTAQTSSVASKPYSPYRISHGLVFVSGQIGIAPKTGKLITSSFSAETEQVLTNIREVLRQAGLDFSDVVNVTVYLKSMDLYAELNTVYTTYFAEPRPARVCIAVQDLPGGANVEIAVVAGERTTAAPGK
jgi:2-iminobutanoate/2-iminopropanoate deaminase